MEDRAGSDQGEHSDSATRPYPAVEKPPAGGLENLLVQQTAMMQMMVQMKELNKRIEIAEEDAAEAMTHSSEAAQSVLGHGEQEALKKLPYLSHVTGNPFPATPDILETDMPQLYDLDNDKTHDNLLKHTYSSMLSSN